MINTSTGRGQSPDLKSFAATLVQLTRIAAHSDHRKAKEYTYLYGSGIGEGSLTPYIADLIHEDIQE